MTLIRLRLRSANFVDCTVHFTFTFSASFLKHFKSAILNYPVSKFEIQPKLEGVSVYL